MSEEQLRDTLAQMVRVGFVSARQPEKMRVRVELRDTVTAALVTDWLPVLCPRACGDLAYDLPDVGDQVLCLFLGYGLEQGFVLGAMYGKAAPAMQLGGAGGGTTQAGMQGTFRLTGGDIIVEGISFLHHVHDCPHGGRTGEPR